MKQIPISPRLRMSFGHFCHSIEQETFRELIAAVMRERIIVKEIIAKGHADMLRGFSCGHFCSLFCFLAKVTLISLVFLVYFLN
jgi:hypothetical protein